MSKPPCLSLPTTITFAFINHYFAHHTPPSSCVNRGCDSPDVIDSLRYLYPMRIRQVTCYYYLVHKSPSQRVGGVRWWPWHCCSCLVIVGAQRVYPPQSLPFTMYLSIDFHYKRLLSAISGTAHCESSLVVARPHCCCRPPLSPFISILFMNHQYKWLMPPIGMHQVGETRLVVVGTDAVALPPLSGVYQHFEHIPKSLWLPCHRCEPHWQD